MVATHQWSRMNRRPSEIIAPHSGWLLRAKAQKAKPGGYQDNPGHIECDAHDERRDA